MKVSKMYEALRSMRNANRGRFVRPLVKPTIAAVVALFTIGGPAFAQIQMKMVPLEKASPEWARIREGLKRAKPMPDPKNGVRPVGTTDSGDLVHYNSLNGAIHHSAHSVVDAEAISVQRREGSSGVAPKPANGDEQVAPKGKWHDGVSALSPVKRPTPASTTPTAPGPYGYPYSFPFNSEFRLLLRFPVSGFADQYYLCSASTASDFYLLSAAHCVYNHDPLDDGSGRGAGFAAEIWAWAAETDVVDPIDPDNWEDYPYGVAKMTNETTYNAWIDNSDLNWDFSFIALDRRIGDHVGWMGQEWGVNAASLNFDGYPAQAPYVASDNPYQYPGFDTNNVIEYTGSRIEMDAYTYGGHSGGGVWRYDGSNNYIEGVNSTSNRTGYAEATQFTSQTNSDLQAAITSSRSSGAPTDLPQLIEYVFNGTSKGLSETSAVSGSSFGLKLNAFNAGYAPAGDTTADIYLTDDETFSSGTYIGSLDLGSLDAYTYAVQTQNVSVPASVSPGTYYVGWVLYGANGTYGTDKNYAIITAQTLQVVALSSVALSPSSVTGGLSTTGTVYLSGAAPSGGATVSLSSNKSFAIVPSSVFVGGGATSASFTIKTQPVTGATTAIITANLGGVVRTATLSVASPQLQTITLSPTSVSGNGTSTGTLTLNAPAPSGGLVADLSSSNSDAKVPATVSIAAGVTSVHFTVTTTNPTSTVSATITAKVKSVSKTATLTITPAAATLSLSLSPSSVTGGHSSTGKVTLKSAATSNTSIGLASSSPHAKAPANVVIQKGSTSATFTITTLTTSSKITANIKATEGSVSTTEPLTINP